jgi:hypothetical protein
VGKNTFAYVVLLSVGFVQWIALVPLILHQRRMNHPRTVQGIIIAGVIGVLLSSACAGLLGGLPWIFRS